MTETPGSASIWNAPSVACQDQGGTQSLRRERWVAIAPGATVTCTFTNTKKPRLTVVKKIVGGNGTTDAFDVKVDDVTKLDNATSADPAGTSWSVLRLGRRSRRLRDARRRLDGGQPVRLEHELQRRLRCRRKRSVQNDQSKTCMITNSKLPKLTVVKVIEGGNGASFDLAVNGLTVLENVGGSGGR